MAGRGHALYCGLCSNDMEPSFAEQLAMAWWLSCGCLILLFHIVHDVHRVPVVPVVPLVPLARRLGVRLLSTCPWTQAATLTGGWEQQHARYCAQEGHGWLLGMLIAPASHRPPERCAWVQTPLHMQVNLKMNLIMAHTPSQLGFLPVVRVSSVSSRRAPDAWVHSAQEPHRGLPSSPLVP